jgi:hypothetical protein
MAACRYCASTNTRKDENGYCKKYRCYEISGVAAKVAEVEREIFKASIYLPTYSVNFMDNIAYNPRKEEIESLNRQKIALIISN